MNREEVLRCTACTAQPSLAPHLLLPCLPVASYGDVTIAEAVTVGLNPADNLFYKRGTRVARPVADRLPMLEEYAASRELLRADQVQQARTRQQAYFAGRVHPWFRSLAEILSLANPLWSYPAGTAAHADSAACATDQWATLSPLARVCLLETCRPHLLHTLETTPRRACLLLNGRTVWDGLRSFCLRHQSGQQDTLRWERGEMTLPDGTTRDYVAWNLMAQRIGPDAKRSLADLIHMF